MQPRKNKSGVQLTTDASNDDKLAYFKLAGDVWAVNATGRGVPGQCQALPKYKQVSLQYESMV